MQSAEKAPFLASFRVYDVNMEALELEDEAALEKKRANWLERSRVQSCIFKVGDDVRQDMMALQVRRALFLCVCLRGSSAACLNRAPLAVPPLMCCAPGD